MKSKKLLSLILVGILSVAVIQPTYAEEATIDDVRRRVEDLERERSSTASERDSLVDQLNALIEEERELQQQLEEKEQEIEVTEAELVVARVEENDQHESMTKRIRHMYENGNIEFLEILFQSESISDFLNAAEFITKISEYDRRMLIEFQEIVDQIAEKEAQLKEEYEELEVLQEDLAAKHQEVEELLEEKSAELVELDQEIGENAELLANLIARAEAEEQARAEAEALAAKERAARRAAEEAGGTQTAPPGPSRDHGNGTFAHPAPEGHLSSGFGWRTLNGARQFHNGHDYASSGRPIPAYAAESGVVVIAGWSNSAGNWVVVNHGNGLVTKYMHFSSLSVSQGQRVERGQFLGMTGNTGWSFGVHLHFEVRMNGRAVDPTDFLYR